MLNIKKYFLAGIFTFTISAFAQNKALAMLECQTSQRAGTSNRGDVIDTQAFIRGPDMAFLVAVYADELWVGSYIFKKEEAVYKTHESDTSSSSNLEITPYLYEGTKSREVGGQAFEDKSEVGLENYKKMHQRVRLGRINGEFFFNETFYVYDITKSTWKNINTSKSVNGFVDRTFEGTCKPSIKKQLF